MMPLNLRPAEHIALTFVLSAGVGAVVLRNPALGGGERALAFIALALLPTVVLLRHLRIRGRALLPGWQD